MPESLSRLTRSDGIALAAMIVIGIGTALALGRDFGQSWDESATAQLGAATLASYSSGEPLAQLPGDLAYYGPGFAASAELGASTIARLFPAWDIVDARHALYFMSFTLGAISVFLISRGQATTIPALGAAALFMAQPLLFGHGFINPKDMPFLGCFAFAMATGMLAIRSIPSSFAIPLLRGLASTSRRLQAGVEIRATWISLGSRRYVVVAVGAFFILAASELAVAKAVLRPALHSLIEQAYLGTATPLLQGLFNRIATNVRSTPLSDYFHKADTLYGTVSSVVVALMAAILVAWFLREFRRPLLNLSHLANPVSGAVAPLAPSLLALAGAGVVTGYATSIRPIAPLAAGLISSLLILRLSAWRYRSVALVAYVLPAALTTYATWPLLWGDPTTRFLEAYRLMSSYPFRGAELFNGLAFTLPELPWYYAPFHFLVQFTLPVIIAGFAGAVIATIRPRSIFHLAESSTILLWMVLPYALGIALRTPLYDRARQILFATTPLFIFSAVFLEYVGTRLRSHLALVAIIIVAALPGLYGIVRLHPYEYIYYNEVVGGVTGASGRYEQDYWGTSYREAIEYLNEQAPFGAEIIVPYFHATAAPYARPDLRVLPGGSPTDPTAADFALIPTRARTEAVYFPDLPLFYRVSRLGVTLAIVRDLRMAR